MVRLFVAFPLPELWTGYCQVIAKRNMDVEGMRWTKPNNLHVTLFFIGEVDESNVDPIKSELQFLHRQKNFRLTFEALTLQGKRSKPGMLWARFERSDDFAELSSGIEKSMKPFMTIENSHAHPIPHCTMARIKRNADTSTLDLASGHFGSSLLVDKAELWQTVQTREGVVYRSLMTVGLV